MKKFLALMMSAMLTVSLLAACSGSPAAANEEPAEPASATEGNETGDEGSEPDENTEEPAAGGDLSDKTIALVCDVAGTQVFVLSMISGLEGAAQELGFTPVVVECADSAAYEDNIRALVQEGTDLIIVGGWQGADALNKIAQEFPDAADYALVDDTVEAENVKCISYREQEGAYLIGLIAGYSAGEDNTLYGGVHVNQGPGSWKWRWGFMEGIRTINPDAKFVFNYTGDYNDPAAAKEAAMLQAEQGAGFINAAAAGGDIGVFEAALEKEFYTSGQDVDLTDPNNPFIISSQMKDTDATLRYVCQKYADGWTTDNEEWGVAEGTIGAVYITHESPNPRSDALTDEQWDAIKQVAEDIKSGKLDLTNMPDEDNYDF